MVHQTVLAIVAGVLAGCISSIVVARFAGAERHARQPTQSAKESPGRSGDGADQDTEIKVERRFRARAPASASAEGSSPRPSGRRRERRSREATEETFARRIAQHRAEPEDTAWSVGAARSLDGDLRALAAGVEGEAPFTGKLAAVACRTTTCSAEFEWGSWAAATSEWPRLLHGQFELNCAREIVLPEPKTEADAALPYRATLLLDCERLRAEATAAAP